MSIRAQFMNGGCITVGDIRTLTTHKKRPRPLPSSSKSSVRCVVWEHNGKYRLVRDGNYRFLNEEAISKSFKEGQLNECMLYIFKHNDPDVPRNADTPVYEACFKCGAYYIKAQKCHLKQAYSNSGRNNIEQRDEIMEDGTAYWVDRYVDGRIKARESKRRYDDKNKKV